MPAEGLLLRSALSFKEEDVVVPRRDVVYLRPASSSRASDRYPWKSDEIGFVVEVDKCAEKTGEILIRILTPHHLGWVSLWNVKAV